MNLQKQGRGPGVDAPVLAAVTSATLDNEELSVDEPLPPQPRGAKGVEEDDVVCACMCVRVYVGVFVVINGASVRGQLRGQLRGPLGLLTVWVTDGVCACVFVCVEVCV